MMRMGILPKELHERLSTQLARQRRVAIVGGDERALRANWPAGYIVKHFNEVSPHEARQLAGYDLVAVLSKFDGTDSLKQIRKHVTPDRVLVFRQSVNELVKQIRSLFPVAEQEAKSSPTDWRLCLPPVGPGNPKPHMWCTADEPGPAPDDPTKLEVEPCPQHAPPGQETPHRTVQMSNAMLADPAEAPAPQESVAAKIEKTRWNAQDYEALRIALAEHGENPEAFMNGFNALASKPRTARALENVLRREEDLMASPALMMGLIRIARSESEPAPRKMPPPPAVTAAPGTTTERKQRMRAAEYAVKRLSSSRDWFKAAELFSAGARKGQWKSNLIKNLSDEGWLETMHSGTPGVQYRAVDPDSIAAFVDDPSPLLSSRGLPMTEAPDAPPPMAALEGDHAPLAGAPHHFAAPQQDPDLKQVMEAILKMLAANVEALERIEKKLDER